MAAAPDPWTERLNDRPLTRSMLSTPDPFSHAAERSWVPRLISTWPASWAVSALHESRLLWTTKVSPRTSIASRSRAVCDPLARANGATPVASVTVNGPSTRIFAKLVTPKLRVAASAGAASKRTETAVRKVRIAAPSTVMVKTALRAANVAGAGLADVALGAAADLHVSGAHDADVGGAARMRFDVAGPRDRDLDLLRLHSARVHSARADDAIFGALRLSRAGLGVARTGDGQLQ